jgi:outer membrane protein assembly factor BamB
MTDIPPGEIAQNAVDCESSAPAGRPLRCWLPVAVLAVYWAFTLCVYYLEMAMFPRFITRMIALALMLVICLVWWLSKRHFRLRERLAVVGIVLSLLFGAPLVADKSINWFMLLLGAMPYVVTLGIAWLLMTRRRGTRVQLTGIVAGALLIFGGFCLLRWDGLDGRQIAQYSWRWSPTAEQAFLATIESPRIGPDSTSVAVPEWRLQPGDWPGFRGADRDDVVGELSTQDWAAHPPEQVWKRLVGPGWSSVIIVDGFLVTQEQRGESEAVVCYDADTGDEVWVHTDTERFDEGLSGPGPRGTPAFAEGRIFALGARGKLNCLAAATGEGLWSHDLPAETGAAIQQWGISTSPLIVGGLAVVFSGGTDGRSLLAYHADTGDLAWSSAGGTQSYSSPQLLTIDGVRQIVMHDNRALYAVHPETGERLWERPTGNEMSLAMLQPHQVGETDLVVAWDNGITRLTVRQDAGTWSVRECWPEPSTRLKPSFNDFFVHDGYIYGLDDGILCCLDLESGKRVWKRGRYGFGQMLYVSALQQFLVLTDQGELVLAAADPERLVEVARVSVLSGKTWNHAAAAHGRLYVRNGEEMACYRLTSAQQP